MPPVAADSGCNEPMPERAIIVNRTQAASATPPEAFFISLLWPAAAQPMRSGDGTSKAPPAAPHQEQNPGREYGNAKNGCAPYPQQGRIGFERAQHPGPGLLTPEHREVVPVAGAEPGRTPIVGGDQHRVAAVGRGPPVPGQVRNAGVVRPAHEPVQPSVGAILVAKLDGNHPGGY